MWSPTANRRRLQLGLVVAVAAVLVLIVLDRAERLAGEAERIAVELQLQSLNHLALLRYATLLAHDGVQALADIEGGNPMVWNELTGPDGQAWSITSDRTRQVGYVGERAINVMHDLEPGSWAFDPGRGTLFYRYRFPPAAHGAESLALVGYRAQLIFDDLDVDGRFDVGRERVFGARVVQVVPR